MPSVIPPEDEIREYAASIDALDEQGRYTKPRQRIVAALLKARGAVAEAAESASEATAPLFMQFLGELLDAGFDNDDAFDLLLAVAPAVVQVHGLHVGPIHEEDADDE